jgi:hypothetical protein
MKKLFTIVHIKNGEVENKSAVRKLFNELTDGKYLIEISSSDKRSSPQNRYYHGICVPMVRHGIFDLGTELTNQETHEFLKSKFNTFEVVNKQTGQVEMIPRSTTMLTKFEFTQYIEKIQRFAAEFLNIVIPDPGTLLTLEYDKAEINT